jgi:hypothetical protein
MVNSNYLGGDARAWSLSRCTMANMSSSLHCCHIYEAHSKHQGHVQQQAWCALHGWCIAARQSF